MSQIADLDAFALAGAYRSGEVSPVEAAIEALARAEAAQPGLNPFVVLDKERTLSAARASEARWRRNEPASPLDGVAFTIKDNMAVKGWPSRKGSTTTSTAPMSFDAPVVARSLEAGLVPLASTTMPEFGWIGASSSPLTGHTRNPWNRGRSAGGSTAGGAVAAALGIGRFHLGSDGLGSIRIPAAWCGVPGIKPTYGLVPAYPASGMGQLAHLGPLAPTVAEVAAFLSILSGPDRRDPNAWNGPARDFTPALRDASVKGLRVAFSPGFGFATKIDPSVARAVAAAARTFEDLGALVEAVDPPLADVAPIAWDIWNAGAAYILSGVPEASWSAMDKGLRDCAEDGRGMRAHEFIAAMNFRRNEAVVAMVGFHERFDLLIAPTMPTGAIPLGDDLPPPGFAGVADWGPRWTDWSPFTPLCNVTQQPAGTVPCGLTDDGMPVGLQIIGWKGRDDLVLSAMRAFEAARPFARVAGLGDPPK